MAKTVPLILVLALLVVLIGCGQGEQASEQELAEELHVYNWSEYIDPEIYQDFEEEFGVKVIEDTFSSNEDLLAKLQAGATGYDLIVPSDYMVSIMRELELLAELNYDNIPNFENISDTFKDPPFDPGNKYSIPYQWGTTGIGYDVNEFEEVPDSWAHIFDPALASQYAGRMTMLNDSREVIGAALKFLGYSLNSTDEQELEEAKELLIQQKEWVSAYDSDAFGDLIASGDAIIGHGWSGGYFLAAYEADNVWYVIPKEGGVIWTDNLAIPKTAPSQYTAEVFINYLLRPEVGAKITNFTWYGSPNEASEEFISAEILEEPGIYPPPEVMEKLEFIRDVGEATTIWDRVWTEIKAE
jgi:spermidine/putrescine transport system substrate-binding protein